MTRSYEEATAKRRARLSPKGKRQAEVFSAAYGMAVELMELRERHGMTQEELAEATGIHQSEISRIERGSANPTAKTLLRIAEALDARVSFVDRSS